MSSSTFYMNIAAASTLRFVGAVFRFIATAFSQAYGVREACEKAQGKLDDELKKLNGMRGELAATEDANRKMSDEEAKLTEARKAAQKLVDDARTAHTLAAKEVADRKEVQKETRVKWNR